MLSLPRKISPSTELCCLCLKECKNIKCKCVRCNTLTLCNNCLDDLKKSQYKFKCPTCNFICLQCINKEEHEICDYMQIIEKKYNLNINFNYEITVKNIRNTNKNIGCKCCIYLINLIIWFFIIYVTGLLCLIFFTELSKVNHLIILAVGFCVVFLFLNCLKFCCKISIKDIINCFR